MFHTRQVNFCEFRPLRSKKLFPGKPGLDLEMLSQKSTQQIEINMKWKSLAQVVFNMELLVFSCTNFQITHENQVTEESFKVLFVF